MNALKQLDSNLVGSQKALRELESKKETVILVISDSHGQKPLVQRIIQDFGSKADALIFCGDGISDILAALEHSISDTGYAACIPPVTGFVQGNGDSDRYPVEFNPTLAKDDGSIYYQISIPKHLLFKASGHKIFVTHGHYEGVYYSTDTLMEECRMAGADVALYGHSHIAKEENSRGLYLLNPGSCCRPRGGLPPSIALLKLTLGSTIFDTTFYKIGIEAGGLSYTPFLPANVSLW